MLKFLCKTHPTPVTKPILGPELQFPTAQVRNRVIKKEGGYIQGRKKIGNIYTEVSVERPLSRNNKRNSLGHYFSFLSVGALYCITGKRANKSESNMVTYRGKRESAVELATFSTTWLMHTV